MTKTLLSLRSNFSFFTRKQKKLDAMAKIEAKKKKEDEKVKKDKEWKAHLKNRELIKNEVEQIKQDSMASWRQEFIKEERQRTLDVIYKKNYIEFLEKSGASEEKILLKSFLTAEYEGYLGLYQLVDRIRMDKIKNKK